MVPKNAHDRTPGYQREDRLHYSLHSRERRIRVGTRRRMRRGRRQRLGAKAKRQRHEERWARTRDHACMYLVLDSLRCNATSVRGSRAAVLSFRRVASRSRRRRLAFAHAKAVVARLLCSSGRHKSQWGRRRTVCWCERLKLPA